MVHFTCPTISSVPHYCTVSTFYRPSQLFLKQKTECFLMNVYLNNVSLCLSRESHVEIHSRVFLSYVGPKHQRDEHNQAGANDCQCLIQICWLSPE